MGVPRSDVGGVPSHVRYLKMHSMLSTHPLPPPREQTDAGENITFPQLAGGNNVRCRFRDSMRKEFGLREPLQLSMEEICRDIQLSLPSL